MGTVNVCDLEIVLVHVGVNMSSVVLAGMSERMPTLHRGSIELCAKKCGKLYNWFYGARSP